ncbi:MAG: ATP-binding protein [bacterium]
MVSFKSSLKTKIVTSIGIVIITLMLFISVVLLLKWREIIIQKESYNALSVSQTFSVTLMDALIFEENSVFQKDNIIETYIDNFIQRLGNVKYVSIYDRTGALIIARSNINNQIKSLSNFSVINHSPKVECVKIYSSLKTGWVIETNLIFNYSSRNWGSAKIAFDAEPIRNEIRSIFFLLLGATILVSTLVLFILYYLVKRLTAKLENFVSVINQIDFVTDFTFSFQKSNDEIGFLYQQFGEMKTRLEKSKKDLEDAQKQIYQAEKLASIGRLASGVAHQVNNPLNGIKSCLYAINSEPDNLQQTKEYLELINEGITNIEEVVKKLLGFARQQPISSNFININDSIEKVVNLFEYRLKAKNIETKLFLNKDIPQVRIEYHLFQEVVMNLILNSSDAIEKQGYIKIYTYVLDKNVCMEIKDNGSGISPQNIKKIFDPFYTTKDIGTGTGLGLSVCLGIIESHGGSITVNSVPKGDTSFIVFLPAENENEIINN